MTVPSGTVTFLFTDLENSTRLWEEFPRAMKGALARHDAILQAAVEAGQGTFVKTTGDGLHAVFAAAAGGIEAVLAAQLALRAEPWGETGPLRVRMALHSGEAELRDGDYYGSVVNRAARIMGSASGDQILLSEVTADLIRDQMPDGVSLLDLGDHYLRGLNRPERLYQVLHPELPAEFPPLKTLGTIPNNLPAQITSFIGREKELAQVQRLLSPGETSTRLVTLTGTGGTGKTRLALQAAGESLKNFPHGVWLVELAPVSDPNQVIQAVAAPMGLRDQGVRPLEGIVADHLRSQQALLILDNCEHLIDECARLAETLLLTCPKLHILASSREALGIAGERPYPVRSLSLPAEPGPADRSNGVENLVQYEAVRLFVERAAEAKPGFALSPDNAQTIAQICRRLDGIPLAIELAAARVRVLSPGQITARLDDRFRLLTGGRRTALPRQRTLQALIDWSYDLLPEEERVLLGRLSAFSGGWTLEAAESITGFEPIEPFEVLDLVEQLVNKSLVVTEASEPGMRYEMLESIRQYAQEKLAQSDEAELMRDRHMAYYLAQSQDAFEALMNLRPIGHWEARFKPEADNFRAAWFRSLEVDVNTALNFAASFSRPWSQIVPIIEILRFQQKALALVEDDPGFEGPQALPENRARLGRALRSATWVALGARMIPLTIQFASRTAVIAEETADLALLAWVGIVQSGSLALTGKTEGVRQWLDEGFSQAMAHGRNYLKAYSLVIWGSFNFYVTGSHSQEAQDRWEEGMAMFRQSGNLWSLGAALQIAANLSMLRQKPDEAERLAKQFLEIYTELGDKYTANPARILLADLARQQGDLERAAQLYRETILVWRDAGRPDAGVRMMECLAYIAHALAEGPDGDRRRARLAYAATLLGAVAAIRQSIGRPMSDIDRAEYERESAEIREGAGESAFESAWAKGQKMDLDQAVQLATGGMERHRDVGSGDEIT